MNLMLFLRHILFLCQKELISTFKDPRMKIQLIVPILLQGFVFGYAANYNLDDIPYAVVDESHSQASHRFLAASSRRWRARRLSTAQPSGVALQT